MEADLRQARLAAQTGELVGVPLRVQRGAEFVGAHAPGVGVGRPGDVHLGRAREIVVADARAANAVSAAQAAAQKNYAARNAALNREAATLNRKSQAIAAEIGELKANTIRADGMYVVGLDIKSGIWHTAGDGHLSGGLCRFTVISTANRSSNPPGLSTLTALDGKPVRRLRFLHLRALHVDTRAIMTGPTVAGLESRCVVQRQFTLSRAHQPIAGSGSPSRSPRSGSGSGSSS
ncbi:MAG TPA: hypothetical protein VF838_16820 [Trebonia sp.]